jgi:predicted peptidase
MKKILIFKLLFLFFLLSCKSFAVEQSKIENKKISDLPVFVTKIENFNANLIGIIGGKGMKNKMGKSKNFLKRYKDNFVEKGIAFYLFPNVNSFTKASYPRRISEDRIGRLNELVKYISSINDKPIFIIGFSRGAVDAGFYAKKYPESISGIILASGIYKNDSNKAKNFSMKKIIGKKIKVGTLIVHHEKDLCSVTQYKYAKSFFKKLKAPKKNLLNYTGGTGTGRECGPYHYHGFEGIELKVVNDIADWINQ